MNFEIIQAIELIIVSIKTIDWDEAKKEIINNIKALSINNRSYNKKDLQIEIKNCIYHLLPQFFTQISYNNYDINEDYDITIEEINRFVRNVSNLISKK